MSTDLRQDQGRLLARLRRQIGKAERLGLTDRRFAQIKATTTELIGVERLMGMDELQRAATREVAVSPNDVWKRLQLLTRHGGLVIPR